MSFSDADPLRNPIVTVCCAIATIEFAKAPSSRKWYWPADAGHSDNHRRLQVSSFRSFPFFGKHSFKKMQRVSVESRQALATD